MDPSTRARISHALRGKAPWNKGKTRVFSARTIARFKARVPWNKGKSGVYSADTLKRLSASHRGQIPWNKGQPFSEEARRRMAAAHRGKRQSEATRRRRSAVMTFLSRHGLKRVPRGPTHPRWQGGRTSFASRWRGRWQWKEARLKVYARDGYRCRACGVACDGSRRPRMYQAHHLVPVDVAPNDDLGNLMTLCKSCHMKVEREREREERSRHGALHFN